MLRYLKYLIFLNLLLPSLSFGAGIFTVDNIVAGSGDTNYSSGASVYIRGVGTTSGTTTLAIINSEGGTVLVVQGDGYIRSKKIWHAFGGFESANTDVPLTQNVWAKITDLEGSLWSGVTGEGDGITISNDTMTIDHKGDYTGNLSLTVTGGNANDYYFRIYNVTNASYVGFALGISTTGAGNIVNIAFPFYFEQETDGEQYELQVVNVTDNDDITMVSGIFYINYLHD